MGFMKSYTNGMKRDSWDVTRDSITGGPRSSWFQDHAAHRLYTSQGPRLSTIHGSEVTVGDGEEPHPELDGQSQTDMCITDVYENP